MTASGRLRRFCGFCGMSAYPPKLTVEADIPDQTASSSLDHLVGEGEQRWRYFEAEHSGGLVVDDQFPSSDNSIVDARGYGQISQGLGTA
jgi:hypothetical protein